MIRAALIGAAVVATLVVLSLLRFHADCTDELFGTKCRYYVTIG